MEVLQLLVALTMLHLQNVRALKHAQRRLKFLKARLHHMEDLKDALLEMTIARAPLHHMEDLKDALLEMTIARKALETLAAKLLLLGSLCRRMHEDLMRT